MVKQPDAWPAEQPLGGSAGQLGGLRLEPVTDKATSRLWNGLIERWHYLGYSPLAGAQLRYPIACSLPLPRGEHRTGHHQRYEGLFQPFQQADEGGAERRTGLGLALSKRQIERMGGCLDLESEPARGCRFQFTFELPPAAGTTGPRPRA